MKTANAALVSLLANVQTGNAIYGDLYTIALRNGVTLYYTDFDRDIKQGGIVFTSRGTLITNAKYKLQRGLEVDEMDMVVYPPATQTINGVPFLQAVAAGLFDRALVTRQRQFMLQAEATAGRIVTPSANAPTIFVGEISDTDTMRTTATLKIKSLLNLLNYNMPRRQYQANCSWMFGDTNCAIARAGMVVTSTASAGSFGMTVLCGLTNAASAFNCGSLKFTSGQNAGINRTIKAWAKGRADLNAPFPFPIATGDAFTILPGCSKMLNANNFLPVGGTGATLGNTYTSFLTNVAFPTSGGVWWVTFTSGALNGQTFQCTQPLNGSVTTLNAMGAVPQNGDSFTWKVVTSGWFGGSTIASGSGAVVGLTTTTFPCNLMQPSGYFTGGTIQFLNGPNMGVTRTVSSWTPGLCVVSSAFPYTPNNGDSFEITQASASTALTCSSYANTSRFGGQPFVPVPEAAY